MIMATHRLVPGASTGFAVGGETTDAPAFSGSCLPCHEDTGCQKMREA
jgi:hypothetical protein